uniref:DNA-directed RNA polymerase n=1 Tax=Panagrolaimus sp. ES5 TaxID=591445 RepID=A0AC34G313_9BILA
MNNVFGVYGIDVNPRHLTLVADYMTFTGSIAPFSRTAMASTCHRSIVREMNNVFGVYGIDVNPRHLTLVADYMTFTGSIAPFSRTAMASSTSSLQKMTFETTMSFMRETLVHGKYNIFEGSCNSGGFLDL